MNDPRYIRFSAKLKGEIVFITVNVKDIDIVSTDNTESFDVENNISKLKKFEFEEIYDG